MDSKEKKVRKNVLLAIEDLDVAITRLDCIDQDVCSNDTLYLIDNAYECINMARKYLDRIDIDKFIIGGSVRNGENIVLKKRPRIKKQ